MRNPVYLRVKTFAVRVQLSDSPAYYVYSRAN